MDESNTVYKPTHPGLRDLRQKIKDVMIPLLVSVFEAKQAAQRLPSRLHAQPSEPPEKIRAQLEELYKGVEELALWCASCKKQIGKALEELETGPTPHTFSAQKNVNPDVKKSFAEALSGKGAPPPTAKTVWWKRGVAFVLQFGRRLKDT